MVKKLITAVVLYLLYSCSNTKILEDGTKIISDRYKNKDKFNDVIYEHIDSNFFYKEIDCYIINNNNEKIRNIGTKTPVLLQFYQNGCIRFLLHKNADPKVTGRRGLIYIYKNLINIETQFSDQDGKLSRGFYSVKIDGKKLYLIDDHNWFSNSEYLCLVYEKSERIPKEWQHYEADW